MEARPLAGVLDELLLVSARNMSCGAKNSIHQSAKTTTSEEEEAEADGGVVDGTMAALVTDGAPFDGGAAAASGCVETMR